VLGEEEEEVLLLAGGCERTGKHGWRCVVGGRLSTRREVLEEGAEERW